MRWPHVYFECTSRSTSWKGSWKGLPRDRQGHARAQSTGRPQAVSIEQQRVAAGRRGETGCQGSVRRGQRAHPSKPHARELAGRAAKDTARGTVRGSGWEGRSAPRSYALPNSTMLLVSFLLVPADRSDGLPYGSSHPEPRSRAPPSHARHRPHRHSRALFPSRCPASTHTRTWRPGRKRRCVPRATRNALSSAIPPCLPAATVPEGCPKQLV